MKSSLGSEMLSFYKGKTDYKFDCLWLRYDREEDFIVVAVIVHS